MKQQTDAKNKHRCFLGIPVVKSVRQQLTQYSETLSYETTYDHLNWVSQSNLHITLHFLGNLSHEDITRLQRALHQERLINLPIPITIDKLSSFPSNHSGRLFVANIIPNKALDNLRALLARLLNRLEHPVESRPFAPHITLARCKRHRKAVHVNDISFNQSFEISSYHLFESTSQTDKATQKTHTIYRSLGEYY